MSNVSTIIGKRLGSRKRLDRVCFTGFDDGLEARQRESRLFGVIGGQDGSGN